MTLLEELTHSGFSCAKVLSVAGFFAVLEPFLARRMVYSGVRKGGFSRNLPSLLQPVINNCQMSAVHVPVLLVTVVQGGMYRGGYTYLGM